MSALLLSVVHSESIHSQLQRLTLTGNGLECILEDYHGKHIKLFFKHPEQAELNVPVLSDGNAFLSFNPQAEDWTAICSIKKEILNMTTLKKTLTTVALGTLPALTLAHPGHDHSDASSMLVHVVFYGSFAAVAVWLAVKSLKKISN